MPLIRAHGAFEACRGRTWVHEFSDNILIVLFCYTDYGKLNACYPFVYMPGHKKNSAKNLSQELFTCTVDLAV